MRLFICIKDVPSYPASYAKGHVCHFSGNQDPEYWSEMPRNENRVMGIMAEALQWSLEMFQARDEMNAKVHCAPVRLSPVTERVRDALKAYGELNTPHAPTEVGKDE